MNKDTKDFLMVVGTIGAVASTLGLLIVLSGRASAEPYIPLAIPTCEELGY